MASAENKSESTLKIKAYSDSGFTNEKGEFETKLNPSDLKISSGLNYNFSTGLGSPRNQLRYSASMPRVLKFRLCFDATGAYNGRKDDVNLQVKNLNDFLYEFKSEIRSPYYLRVIWGVIDFKGRLGHLDISYIMFEANGKPLRAEVAIVIIECEMKPVQSSIDNSIAKTTSPSDKTIPNDDTPTKTGNSSNLANQQNENTPPNNADGGNTTSESTDGTSPINDKAEAQSPNALGGEASALGSGSNGGPNSLLSDANSLKNIQNASMIGSLKSDIAGGMLATAELALIKEIFDDIRDAGNWVKSKV